MLIGGIYIIEYADWWKPKDDIIILPTTVSIPTTLAQPSSTNVPKASKDEIAKDSVLIIIWFLINKFGIICVIFVNNLKIFKY